MSFASLLDAVTDAALARPRIVGSVVLVTKGGRPVYSRSAGFLDRERGIPMRDDAIFRLASFTKPLVAATALSMIERGLLSLGQTVAVTLPYFRPKLSNGEAPDITIAHLLTHTGGIAGGGPAFDAAGVGGGLSDTDLSLDENLRRLAAVELVHAPGKAWVYGKGLDVLGGIVAAIHGSTLEAAVDHYVCDPLGLADTGFTLKSPDRLAVAYADNLDGVPLRMPDPHFVAARGGRGGSVLFSPRRMFNPKAFQSGGSGALGSAPDFIRFLEALRQGGAPILSEATMSAATRNQIGNVEREPEAVLDI